VQKDSKLFLHLNETLKKILRNLFSKVSFRKKLSLSYTIVVIIPVLLVGFYFVSGLRDVLLEQALVDAQSNVLSIKRELMEDFEFFAILSDGIYINQQVEKIVTTKFETPIEARTMYMDFNLFNDYMILHDELNSIRFYAHNDTIMENWQFMRIRSNIKNLSWFQNAVALNGHISWQYSYNELTSDNFMNLSRYVRTFDGFPLGVLVMDMCINYLFMKFRHMTGLAMLVDSNGKIVTSNRIQAIGLSLEEMNLDDMIISENKRRIDFEFNEVDSILISENVTPVRSRNTFHIVSITPVDSILETINNRIFFAVLFILGSFVLAFVLINIFSLKLSLRIRQLTAEMRKVAAGKIETVIKIKGNDEIAQMADDINTMLSSVRKLQSDLYDADLRQSEFLLKQKEIKLKMLANQINPHFLFNTLEAIRMKAHSSGQLEIANKVRTLGKIIRFNLEVSDELVTLESEIQLVKNYLEIQHFRYGDRLKYKIEVDESLYQKMILPLIIQPIAENAVIHGLENIIDSGEIYIKVIEMDSFLEIRVEDNGLGLDENQLKNLILSLDKEDSEKKIGLKNVHQRIRLLYGDAYGVQIYSEKGNGTKVVMSLPLDGRSNV